jgi:NadR type nicotinamide-nucleotide adenylyltransferase
MTRFSHGLIVGKFYPPHLGHLAAISRAAADCDQVSVVVMASTVETITLAERVEWLRADCRTCPNVAIVGIPGDAPVDIHSDSIWQAQIALMNAALRDRRDAGAVDAVFTAEPYGTELSRRLGARLVVSPRPSGGMSGTSARTDLAGAWAGLTSATRAGLTLRVVFVGAESTGTTTVSRAVAERFRSRGGAFSDTRWVGEFGRDYTEIKWLAARDEALAAGRDIPELDQIVWNSADFDRVATEQNRREFEALSDGSPVLLCDTDAFATSLWERRYLGESARRNQEWARSPLLSRRDIYFVTDHVGVPWEDDGMREGDMEIRSSMTSWFTDALTAAGHSWVLLVGTLAERIDVAMRTIDPLLTHRATLSRPLQGPGFEHTR